MSAPILSPETIRKFTIPRGATRTHLAPIVKDGVLVPDAPGDGKSYAMWMDITPALATTWLKNNFGNRPISEDVVRAYARDMINNLWVATHQGIAFNDEDRLIDGQHRLRAVILANKTVRMMVTFALPSVIAGSEMTTMDAVDRGRTRSVADQLTIQHGFKYGSLTASLCSAIASICCGERTRRLSVGQTLDVYRAFEASIVFVIEHRSKEHGLKSAGVLAAFAFAHALQGKPVETMFFQLNSPEAVAGAYPVIALLRAFLTSDEAKLISRSLDRGLAEMSLQVLWLEHTNTRVPKLEMSLDGANWYRAQQPERVKKIAGIFKLPVPVPDPVPARVVTDAATGFGSFPVTAAPAPVPSTPAAAQSRPTVADILQAVENHSKLAKFIICGKGQDADLDLARFLIVNLATSYGHTAEAIGVVLRRPAAVVKTFIVPTTAWTGKQSRAFQAVKSRLPGNAK